MLVQRLRKVLHFLFLAPRPFVPQLLLFSFRLPDPSQAPLQLHLADVLELSLRRGEEAVLQEKREDESRAVSLSGFARILDDLTASCLNSNSIAILMVDLR